MNFNKKCRYFPKIDEFMEEIKKIGIFCYNSYNFLEKRVIIYIKHGLEIVTLKLNDMIV